MDTRRSLAHYVAELRNNPARPRRSGTLDAVSIIKKLGRTPLSSSLREALRFADEIGAADLERWCRLELGGYLASNSAMDEQTIVPEYRAVVGQHVDIYGRVLMLPSNLSFVDETRLRNGIEELEVLSTDRDMVTIHDPHMCELIKQHLEVQVHAFRFSSIHLTGVLASIRIELEDRLGPLSSSTRMGTPGLCAKQKKS